MTAQVSSQRMSGIINNKQFHASASAFWHREIHFYMYMLQLNQRTNGANKLVIMIINLYTYGPRVETDEPLRSISISQS